MKYLNLIGNVVPLIETDQNLVDIGIRSHSIQLFNQLLVDSFKLYTFDH